MAANKINFWCVTSSYAIRRMLPIVSVPCSDSVQKHTSSLKTFYASELKLSFPFSITQLPLKNECMLGPLLWCWQIYNKLGCVWKNCQSYTHLNHRWKQSFCYGTGFAFALCCSPIAALAMYLSQWQTFSSQGANSIPRWQRYLNL